MNPNRRSFLRSCLALLGLPVVAAMNRYRSRGPLRIVYRHHGVTLTRVRMRELKSGDIFSLYDGDECVCSGFTTADAKWNGSTWVIEGLVDPENPTRVPITEDT